MSDTPTTSATQDGDQSSVWARVEATAGRVETKLQDLQRTQRTFRIILLIIALVIAAEIAIFVLMGYNTVQKNFEPTRLKTAAAASMNELTPEILDTLVKVSQDVAPLYQEKISAKMQAVYPDILDGLETEFASFPDEVSTEAGQVMTDSLNRVVTRLQPSIKETFPELKTENDVTRFMNSFQNRADEKLVAVSADMQTMFDDELQRLSDAFFEFNPAPNPPKGEPTLEQNLIHHLLQLVDDWVMSSDDPAELLEELQSNADLTQNTPLASARQEVK